ncbi:hypothetical protein [Rhodoplanes sp. Z2-YC6860]|uniref:hypothetical protein n=1 Tax=Rhodoplanes sp. Z2-YC6860 TaxID=674703 RepID=UPI00078CA129|nr:hypothetical protein [Rhodoplanes sp. Z2-YC6860]AMN43351.1 hypothetical protein RHPLAN_49270 [Rhodoplanes sp. Z2-YC6860]
MPRVLRVGGALAATLFLLAPAVWNRFPLLQYDTGGYLARWFEGYLVPSRSTVYGLFLTLLSWPDFWPVVIVQSALTVWMLALLLRVLGFGDRPLLVPRVTAVLCLFTTLPWLSGILLTDIFAALAVLAAYLLIFSFDALSRLERRSLVALIAFSVATHSATFAVVLALVLAAVVVQAVRRIGAPQGIVRSAAAVLLGALLLLSANYVTSGRFVWTPGGIALSFGRMLQDGIVVRYLDEHCPDKRLRLCAYRHELPTDADEFFWSGNGTIFNKLGRFDGLGNEMGLIVTESLRAYPAWQLQAAAVATLRQLVRVSTGEGVLNSVWHSYAIIEKFTPHAAPAMHAARQQHGELSFSAINDVQRPLALAAMLLLVPLMLWGSQRQAMADFGKLAATTACALLANAVVCGVFSNPHDRYGARLAWLAPLVVGLAALRLYEQRRDAEAALRVPPGVPAGSTLP